LQQQLHLPSGAYFLRLQQGNAATATKIVLLK
jgi:hypothetical protein